MVILTGYFLLIITPHCTASPVLQYNLDYYLKLAEQLVDHGIHALAIKVGRFCNPHMLSPGPPKAPVRHPGWPSR